ncbi:hypothetical protein Y1Q_0006094 [Alligator mississippiensis]|uniref:Uncharacterized protein n=1 Tax=Alligator mississippiensis TaxID=8496 RepID=A0A151N3X4_ALLMI|nr:hypothetical protein Y1Q_0006094 [Alligator mississippiensis]
MRSASRRETALLQLAPSANPSGCGKSTNLLGCIALGQVGNSVSELGDRRMFSSLQGCAGSWRFPGSAIASFRHNTPHLSHGQRKMLCEASQDWAMGGHAFLFHFEGPAGRNGRIRPCLPNLQAMGLAPGFDYCSRSNCYERHPLCSASY